MGDHYRAVGEKMFHLNEEKEGHYRVVVESIF